MKVNEIIGQLTVAEKAALVQGRDFVFTNSVPRLNVPSIEVSDGPHGLRRQVGTPQNGISDSLPATAFPTAATVASSWNVSNAEQIGKAIAEECCYYGVSILLGPAANIKRNPLCGRNFEYFSEDPLLAGQMATAEVNGVQSKGVGVAVKHFALNNAENYRFMGDSICDERAMRELYLKVFEIIVKQSKPATMMCAYNKINGTYCSENNRLLNEILREEWGFDGLVMSDWGATHDRVKGISAGLDLEMPGDTAVCRKWTVDAINNGKLPERDLDKAVERVLNVVDKYCNVPTQQVDWDKHNELSAQIAADSAVLLKNDGALPLSKDDKLLVIGDLFDRMRYQGAGSSMIKPYALTTPKTAFDAHNVNYCFVRGYAENQTAVQPELIDEALSAADQYKRVIVFMGLTDYVESEGCDRENMRLPDNQLALIDALIKSNKQVVVVLFGGSSIELPFADKVSAILNMYLPGQSGGKAAYDLLFGNVNPSGKLAESWPLSYNDVPFGDSFSSCAHEVYKESVYVGYRYYLTANKPVRYPFGYGLSYTDFQYSNMTVKQDDKTIEVSCNVKNVGKYDGAEVVQLYVDAPKEQAFKPKQELKGFAKVYLHVGESKTVTIVVNKDDLRYWNVRQNRWATEGGEYKLLICSDCLTVKLSQTLTIEGEQVAQPYNPEVDAIYRAVKLSAMTDEVFEAMSGLKIPPLLPVKPITVESRLTDLRCSFMGRIFCNAVLGVADKDLKKAQKMPEGVTRDNRIKGAMFMRKILVSNSLISLSMSAGKSMPYNIAEGFVEMGNGHFFKGLAKLCKPYKIKLNKADKEK